MGVLKNSWFKMGQSHLEMDDLGVLLIQETSIWVVLKCINPRVIIALGPGAKQHHGGVGHCHRRREGRIKIVPGTRGSMDWSKGHFTGNLEFSWENRWFPVSIFPKKPDRLIGTFIKTELFSNSWHCVTEIVGITHGHCWHDTVLSPSSRSCWHGQTPEFGR